jgi:hypothetical protein
MSKSSTRNKIDVLKSWINTVKIPKKKTKLTIEQLYEELNKIK